MTDRALTVRQPCAHLIVVGFKPVENRSKPWPSTLALPCRIGIHAGKGDHPDCWGALLARDPDPPAVVYGALIGFVTVVGFHHADECRRTVHTATCQKLRESEHEVAYCDPSAMPGMWHYELEDPEPLEEPLPMRGSLGLWRLPEEVAA